MLLRPVPTSPEKLESHSKRQQGGARFRSEGDVNPPEVCEEIAERDKGFQATDDSGNGSEIQAHEEKFSPCDDQTITFQAGTKYKLNWNRSTHSALDTCEDVDKVFMISYRRIPTDIRCTEPTHDIPRDTEPSSRRCRNNSQPVRPKNQCSEDQRTAIMSDLTRDSSPPRLKIYSSNDFWTLMKSFLTNLAFVRLVTMEALSAIGTAGMIYSLPVLARQRGYDDVASDVTVSVIGAAELLTRSVVNRARGLSTCVGG